MFADTLKLEFHSDHTAHKPKPFEIQILNAADHVQTLLYALRAFFREHRIPGGLIMDRSNRPYSKSGKFRNMLQHGDHILLGTLETNVNFDQNVGTHLHIPGAIWCIP